MGFGASGLGFRDMIGRQVKPTGILPTCPGFPQRNAVTQIIPGHTLSAESRAALGFRVQGLGCCKTRNTQTSEPLSILSPKALQKPKAILNKLNPTWILNNLPFQGPIQGSQNKESEKRSGL